MLSIVFSVQRYGQSAVNEPRLEYEPDGLVAGIALRRRVLEQTPPLRL